MQHQLMFNTEEEVACTKEQQAQNLQILWPLEVEDLEIDK